MTSIGEYCTIYIEKNLPVCEILGAEGLNDLFIIVYADAECGKEVKYSVNRSSFVFRLILYETKNNQSLVYISNPFFNRCKY
jgi:hypothetical protein